MTKQNKNILLIILGILGISAISKAASSSFSSALNFIKKAEGGLYLKAYQDSGGVWTVGYGSTYDFDKQRKVQQGDIITEAQAQRWLEMETSQNAKDIDKLVTVPLTNNQKNALVSFVYNVGINGFKASTMLKLLNSGADKSIVADQFDRWVYDNGVKVKGLINRRKAEKDLFLS
jgi:lysozyme